LEGVYKMSRKMVEVKSLYGSTVEDLKLIADNTDSNYTRDVVQAVIQRYNGVPTKTIAENLDKSLATIVNYINNWNEKGIACIADNRGGNIPSSLTDAMVEDIREIVTTKSPHDFNYEHNRWNSSILSRYVEDTYGNKYSDRWIRKLLRNLRFSYKRGVYKPTKGDAELQESFKKKCPRCWKLSKTQRISPSGSLTKQVNV
jgi:transposase